MSFDNLKKKHAAALQAQAEKQANAVDKAAALEAALPDLVANIIRPVFEEAREALNGMGLDAELAEDQTITDLGGAHPIKIGNARTSIVTLRFRRPTGPKGLILTAKVPVILYTSWRSEKISLAAIDVSSPGARGYTVCAEFEHTITRSELHDALERILDATLSHEQLQ